MLPDFYWIIVLGLLLFAVLVAAFAFWTIWRQRRDSLRQQCKMCGRARVGLPSNICQECGTSFEIVADDTSASKPAGVTQPEAIRIDADGFDVLIECEHQFRVNWPAVRGIAAFKRDLYSYDEICIAFFDSPGRDYVFVHEHMDGFSALMQEVERRYPQHDADWWRKVVLPPFCTCWTVIWGDAPEPAVCPQCKGDISGVTADACPHCQARLETGPCPHCGGLASRRDVRKQWRRAGVGLFFALVVAGGVAGSTQTAVSKLRVFLILAGCFAIVALFFSLRSRRVYCLICEHTGWLDPRGRALRIAGGFRGVCEKCSYPLSHLPGDRCPECGTKFRTI